MIMQKRAIQLNSVEYLLKPIDFEKLKQAVCQAAEVVIKREGDARFTAGKYQMGEKQENIAEGYLENRVKIWIF